MKKIILIVLLLFFLNGCGTKITVPIDSSLISKNEATVIVFYDQGATGIFTIVLDDVPIGVVSSEEPLKFSVLPGKHNIYVNLPMAIKRTTKQYFEAGKAYFMRVWLDHGMWMSSIRINSVDKIDSYKTTSYRQ